MSIDRYKVLDLTGGIGGFSSAFEQAEFDVVCAIEGDSQNADIYKSLVRNNNLIEDDILNLDGTELPYADIITADLTSTVNIRTAAELNRRNEHISNIILNRMPKMFLVRAPLQFVRNNDESMFLLSMALQRRYYITYSVFREADYSGFPVSSNQLYIIGIASGIPFDTFEFPQPIYFSYYKDVYTENYSEIDEWYRKHNPALDFGEEPEKHKYYTVKKRKFVKSETIGYNMFGGTYYTDDYGLRRVTHNEYSMLKGYGYYNFNECSNKFKMYRRIASAPNVFIVRALAESVLKYLHEINTSDLKPKLEVFAENESGKDLKKRPRKDKENDIRKDIVFPKQKLLNIHIEKPKGLKNLDILIEKNLTAIMGVNGAGKSTVLHALACMYLPNGNGTYYPFSFFFTPTPDSIWNGSRLSITYFDENKQDTFTRVYKKESSWTPSRSNKPVRDVFYIGIDTGLPEIEKERQTSFIDYSTNEAEDKISVSIINMAADILNKDYRNLAYNKTRKKELLGIHTNSGIRYSSLSMGAGEQRLIKILRTVMMAPQYSLILIDEIELLLHIRALKRLIINLSAIAQKRNLQIIFTTHSPAMNVLTDYVDIRYLHQLPEKTVIYDTINPDLTYELSDSTEKCIEIFVEDLLAETIVRKVARDLKLSGKVDIRKYGSINNAFTLAAAFILEGRSTQNTLVVLDGDKYTSALEKNKAIKRVLTGTEYTHEQKIDEAISAITQFNLPESTAPEKFIHCMLVDLDIDDEFVQYAKEINAVSDNHEWIDTVVNRMGEREEVALSRIIDIVATHPSWNNYIEPIREWLIDKKGTLGL